MWARCHVYIDDNYNGYSRAVEYYEWWLDDEKNICVESIRMYKTRVSALRAAKRYAKKLGFTELKITFYG